MQCTVHNINYESKQAVKRIVNTVSKDGMTPFDKMQAFVDYVESKHPRYYWNNGHDNRSLRILIINDKNKCFTFL